MQSKYTIYRILRGCEAIFQKGILNIFGPKNVFALPHEGKGLYGLSGNQRLRTETKGAV